MSNFIGLCQSALDFLKVVGRPAIRKVVIEYPDGSSKIVSSHKFTEISYEAYTSTGLNETGKGQWPLLAYYKDDVPVYEERVQCEFRGFVFTALWDLEKDNWLEESLWKDFDIQSWV